MVEDTLILVIHRYQTQHVRTALDFLFINIGSLVHHPDDPLHTPAGFGMAEWYGHILLNEVNKGSFSLEKLVEITSVNGAKIFGFYPRKGSNLPGTDADFTICDMNKEWTIDSDKIYMKTHLNAYHGRKLKGKVTHTIVRGNVIMENGDVIGKPGFGQFILPDQK